MISTQSRDNKLTTGTHHDYKSLKIRVLIRRNMEQTYRIKTVKFDEFRYVLMSDLN